MSEPDDEILRAWLLHRLPEEASAALEERLLLDEAFGLHLHAVETDLLDDHARGVLDPAQRAAVERWLLATPADRERLRAARALAAASARPASPVAAPTSSRRTRRRRVAWLGFATAAALLLALCLPLRRSGPLPPPASPALASAQTITLLADVSRGTGDAAAVAVRLPPAGVAVRLQAEAARVEPASAGADARYVLRIRAPAREVFQARGLLARSEGAYRFVEATVPPATLAAGDYRVSLAAEGDGAATQEWTLRVSSR